MNVKRHFYSNENPQKTQTNYDLFIIGYNLFAYRTFRYIYNISLVHTFTRSFFPLFLGMFCM